MASPIAELASALHPLRAARMLRGLSQRDLEKKAGLPRTSASHFENGTREPDEGQKARIAMALEVDVEDLFSPPAVVEAEPTRDTPERHRSTHPYARHAAEQWVRDEGRRVQLCRFEEAMRRHPFAASLDSEDVAELRAFAERLKHGKPDHEYARILAEAGAFASENGGTLTVDEMRRGLIEGWPRLRRIDVYDLIRRAQAMCSR